MDRRDALILLGGAAAVGAGAGAVFYGTRDRPDSGANGDGGPGAGTPSTEPPARNRTDPSASPARESFDRVANAVDDLGMDPTGARPIDDALDDALGDGVLLEFPPGDYLIARSHAVRDAVGWGVRGLGDDPTDVQFRPPAGEGYYAFNVRSGRDVLIENVAFDMREGARDWIGNVFNVADGLTIRDVRYVGFWPDENHAFRGEAPDVATMLRVQATDPAGTAVVDGLVRDGPAQLPAYPDGGQGIFAGPSSVGTIVVRNSRFENMPMHGVYASRTEGPVRVEDTTFRNVNGVMCRVSGADSWVRNCRFVWDVADAHPDNAGRFRVTDGLWCESGFQAKAGPLVDGCEFVCRSAGRVRGMIEVDGSVGATTIRDCTLHNDVDGVPFVDVNEVGQSGSRVSLDGATPPEPSRVVLRGVACTGSSSGDRGVVDVAGRAASVVRDCRIAVDGDRDGIAVRGADGVVVRGTTIELGGRGAGIRLAGQTGAVVDGGRVATAGSPIVVTGGDGGDGCPLTIRSAPTIAWQSDRSDGLSSSAVSRHDVAPGGCAITTADASNAGGVVVVDASGASVATIAAGRLE